jgi:endo-1,4-beta-mannosidase
MLPPFDIFRLNDKGELIWCLATATLDEAMTKVQQLSEAEFVIVNQNTQEKIAVKPEVKPLVKRASA